MGSRWAALTLVLLATTPVRAGVFDAALDDSAPPQAATPPAMTLGGYARSDVFVGRVPAQDAAELKSGYGELALKAEAKLGARGDTHAELRLRRGREWGDDLQEAQLREAYVNLYLGPVDLRLGEQIIAWGRADGFNPTDNLTPRDMAVRSADEDDRRTANLALRSLVYLQPLELELVWVPFFEPTRLPPLALPVGLVLGELNRPTDNLRNGTGAVRLHWVSAALDASVSYLAGRATMPGLRFDGAALDATGPTVALGLTSYRQQVVGVDFATTLGGAFGLRGEAAYRRPFRADERNDIPRPDLQVVLGADLERGDVSVIAQYLGHVVEDWTALGPGVPDDLARLSPAEQLVILSELDARASSEVQKNLRALYGQQARTSHAASLRVRWSAWHDTLELAVFGYYGLTTREYLVRPSATYAIADALTLAVGGEIFGGPNDTLWGLVDEVMSAAYLELKASF